MPGVRSAVYLAAGSLRLPYRQQFLYDGLARRREVPLLVFAVRYVGGNWQTLLPRSPWAQGLVLAAVVLLGAVAWAIRRRLRR